MKHVRTILRWAAIVSVGLLVLVQFVRPVRTNPLSEPELAMDLHLTVDAKVRAILDRSCADCHSNNTRWPWYSRVSPVSWWVVNHVNEGRNELNLSEWGTYSRTDQAGKLRQICREVKGGSMPLRSYTPMHPESKLSADDVKSLCDWTDIQRAQLEGKK